MSSSKNLYESMGWTGFPEKPKLPILEVGTRFSIKKAYKKVDIGNWEIVVNENAPYYKCRRILKNGLHATWSVSNERTFSESDIYKTFKQSTV